MSRLKGASIEELKSAKTYGTMGPDFGIVCVGSGGGCSSSFGCGGLKSGALVGSIT